MMVFLLVQENKLFSITTSYKIFGFPLPDLDDARGFSDVFVIKRYQKRHVLSFNLCAAALVNLPLVIRPIVS